MKNKWKKAIRAVVFPQLWFQWIFGIASIALCLAVIVNGCRISWLNYACYAFSILGLWYLIHAALVPIWRKIDAVLNRVPVIRRYREEAAFHARVALYGGLFINVGYAILKLISGICYQSAWFMAIAVYYLILSGIKAYLVRQDIHAIKRNDDYTLTEEWKVHRTAGWLLILMNAGLFGIGILVVYQNRSYNYPGLLIYAMAAYTFYRIVVAIIRTSRAGRTLGPLLLAAKYIDLCFAVIAMYTLQTAMLAAFSGDFNARIPNAVTGAIAAVIITAVAISMIIRASGQLRIPSSDH